MTDLNPCTISIILFSGLGSEFKRPKMNGEGDREGGRAQRRFSQASTNSSASFDDTDTVER